MKNAMIAVASLCSVLTLAMPQIFDEEPAELPTIEKGFIYRTVVSGGKTYAYNVFVPPTYRPDRAWPLILFLHGSGERGNDGFLQTDVGIAHAIRKNHSLIPAIVVMPQCPQNQTWTEPTSAKMALTCVEDATRRYNVDSSRLYLTGLSLGGRGTWYIAARVKNGFAAMVPICGGGNVDDAAKLTDLPIWCFHGSADQNVPPEETDRMVEAIERAGGTIEYTRMPGANHVIWDRVYANPKLWQWLFAQQRQAK
ncbi:MAG: prolyl oligopeptidase family serine peptidase [Phycisphaerae bacterium]